MIDFLLDWLSVPDDYLSVFYVVAILVCSAFAFRLLAYLFDFIFSFVPGGRKK